MAKSSKSTKKNHIISWRKVREFLSDIPKDTSAEAAFALWYDTVQWTPLDDFHTIKNVFGNASLVDGLVVFNVGGNKYRLVAEVIFGRHRLLIRHILTHGDYDKGKWKS